MTPLRNHSHGVHCQQRHKQNQTINGSLERRLGKNHSYNCLKWYQETGRSEAKAETVSFQKETKKCQDMENISQE